MYINLNNIKTVATEYSMALATTTFGVAQAVGIENEGSALELTASVATISFGFAGALNSSVKAFYNEDRAKNLKKLPLYLATLGLGIYKLVNFYDYTISSRDSQTHEIAKLFGRVKELESIIGEIEKISNR